jgi:tetratricopeptide (TPR) repeat protein
MLPSALAIFLSASCLGQQPPQSDQQSDPGVDQNEAPPRSDQNTRDAGPGESSSRDTRIDISPPKDDAKNHPNSGVVPPDNPPATPDAGAPSDVQELHPWNPYRAVKDDEVGDFYFKRKNYKAALARYQDALQWKERDATATFRIAQCYEKLNQPDEAIAHYQEYLKILPDGPSSKEARKALQKLGAPQKSETSQVQPNQ